MIYAVMHVMVHDPEDYPREQEDVKLIGIFSSKALAEASVAALRNKPGFRDFPAYRNHEEVIDGPAQSGFEIAGIDLDHYGWKDGYSWLIEADDGEFRFSDEIGGPPRQ